MAKKQVEKSYAEGIADSILALNALKGNSRKEFFVLIDQCIGVVADLIPKPTAEEPAAPEPDKEPAE